MEQSYSKLTKMVSRVGRLPTPILNKSVVMVISGFIKLRKSLEGQPHYQFGKPSSNSMQSARVIPPPFRQTEVTSKASVS